MNTERSPSMPASLAAPGLRLEPGSRVAVVGGGPAGTFFTYFLYEMAGRLGLELSVDIYEPRDFEKSGPAGCNMCGGIISESLVRLLATEGIDLPPAVVQRGIDSYVLHLDVGNVRIDPPRREKRIAAVHRGAGPRGIVDARWRSFDGHLMGLARKRGATVIHERVDGIVFERGRPRVATKRGLSGEYDLLAGAVGVNTDALKLFEKLGFGYRAPGTTKTYICEFLMGEEALKRYLGDSMHVFLPNLPRLEFAAVIPKGDYVTVCLLGESIDRAMVDRFLFSPEVREIFPPGWAPPGDFCRCAPSINLVGAAKPFADRVVLIGDSGVTRLYKDGIGGAYRTAKAAASTAVYEGVSEEDFRRHYLPTCRALARDNAVGKVIFGITTLIQNMRVARKGLLRMITEEQRTAGAPQRMSGVLWDTFTGSAPYADVFVRTLHPSFIGRMLWETGRGMFGAAETSKPKEENGSCGEPGETSKIARAGEITVRREGSRGESEDRRVLLTSPTSYMGRRLMLKLLSEPGVRLRVLVTDRRSLGPFPGAVPEVVEGDLLDDAVLRRAAEGIDAAYFPIRFLGTDPEYDRLVKKLAGKFRDACIAAGVERIVFLGAYARMAEADAIVRAIVDAGEILSARPDRIRTVWLHVGFILGSGSLLFELLRNFVVKFPVLPTPRWMESRVSAIGARDLQKYLIEAIRIPLDGSIEVEVGLPPRSVREMLCVTARVMGRKRVFLPLPFEAKRLSAVFLTGFTPFSSGLSTMFIRLVSAAGKSHGAVSADGARRFFPGIVPAGFETAITRAIDAFEGEEVLSRWTDSIGAISAFHAEEEMSRAMFRDVRTESFAGIAPERVFQAVTSIGGKQGWFTFDLLWRIRGAVDKLTGGFGTSIGRRDGSALRVGDVLDVWRVIDLQENRLLLLQAQMKVFGMAWLEFRIEGDTLVQTAYHSPRGLAGRLYWYSMSPFHAFIFRDMTRSIVRRAGALG